MIRMTIEEAIRMLGPTNYAAAKKLGVSRAYVQGVRTGRYPLYAPMAQRIEAATGKSLGDALPPLEEAPGAIAFRIANLPLPNRVRGKAACWQWVKASKLRKALAEEVAACLPVPRPAALEKARVEIVRYTVSLADEDNLHASVKPLLDVLQPAGSAGRKYGLGMIESDSPASLHLIVRQEKVHRRALQRTDVVVSRA